MSFLTAEWNNLVMINYTVNPKLLEKYVPAGTELDFFEGKCFISSIGFMFENVKLLGLKIPFHTNFEEVNLRFYVRRLENGTWKRGAVFISEIVPKRAISILANALYNEHYSTLKMKHHIEVMETVNFYQYEWKRKGKWQKIEIETSKNPIEIAPDSEAEFITEHYFGYTKVNDKTSYEYEVRHPRWEQLEVKRNNSVIDFQLYGEEFEFLNREKPSSIFLAIGSAISIEGKKVI